MDDFRVDDHAGRELVPRAGFTDALRRELASEWPVAQPVHRRWQTWAGVAAAAAAVVGGVLIAGGDDEPSRIAPATTVPVTTSIPPSTTPVSTLPPSELTAAVEGREWHVWFVDGARTSGTPTFTLAADGTVAGFDGCNTWALDLGGTGRWAIDGTTLRLDVAATTSTAVQCFTTPVQPLADGTELALDEAGRLHLTAPDGTESLATMSDTFDMGTTEVASGPVSPLTREVLWTTVEGDGEGELGWEDCQECDPAGPWSPLVSDHGTIVIADAYNGRWLLVRDGDVTTVPIDGSIVGQPLYLDGFVFVPVQPSDLSTDVVVRAYDPEEMTSVLAEVDVPDVVQTQLTVSGDRLLAGSTEVRQLSPYSAGATVVPAFDQQPATLALTWNGLSRHFQFPSWAMLPMPLADGSVLVDAELVDEVDAPAAFVRLFPDGTVAAGTPAASRVSYSQLIADQRGIVQLESDGTTFEVVRYSLPRAAAGGIELDSETGAVLGFAPGPQDVDTVVAATSAALGQPDDGGWVGVSDQFECSGATEQRQIRWPGLTATFVRDGGWTVLAGWTLGDGVTTTDGIGIGSTTEDVRRAWLDRIALVDGSGSMTVKWDVLHLGLTLDSDVVTGVVASHRLCS